MFARTLKGIRAALWPLALHFWYKYVLVAVGSVLVLLLLYGINEVIKKTTINFPASVCLMLLMFGGLSLSSWLFGEDKTNIVLRYIDIPFGFALRWMNIYFTPPFVTLVLSDKVSVAEAFTIAAVFVVGYLIGFGIIAYFTWGLQILLGTYKTDMAQDEETQSQESDQDSNQIDKIKEQIEDKEGLNNEDDPHRVPHGVQTEEIEWEDKVKSFLLQWVDFMVYGILFWVGVVVYYTTGYEMPVQLSTAVLLFRVCMLQPLRWRRFLHPILISFSVSLLVFYILSVIKGQNFFSCIRHYKTGRTYLHLFDANQYTAWPGAGDFFISLMDISIVSLSLAMYNYRKDLKRYFVSIAPPIVLCSFMSFFIYPPVCYHLGISASRSLGFTGRSVTMALGMPLVIALDGSTQLMAVTTIISGILGVLCGDFMLFKMFRVRKHDFVTRGVTFGVNCGAVSTAYLIDIDPRAGAMSSLAFTLFGTLMIVFSAIDPLVRVVQRLVGW
ncbi:hypothetical protein OGAPHI_001013 [Ogataea philodendri]|uniref:LrgB-like protein n=1 Tax=Ogataea philodendri TaxID=1378263 RepID=A0A9P8PDZ1_9ASCO|nr:uncharacterized protein OGAPHI_001013 [Ogataea philodendri]KAH3670498.1 hypothetical protein OGAPHI_001013 [Ogataea philodendri]